MQSLVYSDIVRRKFVVGIFFLLKKKRFSTRRPGYGFFLRSDATARTSAAPDDDDDACRVLRGAAMLAPAASAPSRGSPPTAARPRPESFPPVLPAAAPTLILPEHAAPRDFPTPRKSRQVPSLLLPRISRSPSRSASGRIFHGGSSRGGPRVPTGGFFVVF